MSACCNWTYHCPEAKETECIIHGGFEVCCEHRDCPMLGRTRRGVRAQVAEGVADKLHELWSAKRNHRPHLQEYGDEGATVDTANTSFKDLPRELQRPFRLQGRHAVAVAAYADELEAAVEELHRGWDNLEGRPERSFGELSPEERLYGSQVVLLARDSLGMEGL